MDELKLGEAKKKKSTETSLHSKHSPRKEAEEEEENNTDSKNVTCIVTYKWTQTNGQYNYAIVLTDLYYSYYY